MDAVSSHQVRSTRIRSLVAIALASGAVAGLIIVGAMPGKGSVPRTEDPSSRVEPRPTQPGTCALCGTIESVRVVEVYEDPGVGSADAKSADAAGGASGATAGAAASVLDTLANAVGAADTDRRLRKRNVYRVTLRMDDGSYRALSLPKPPAFSVGDKVRVVEGRLVRA